MIPAVIPFALGLGLAPFYLALTNRPPGWFRSVVKTLPLALFALAAFLAEAPPFLTLALVFSALGDLALSRDGRMAFLYGLAAFALGHLVYILLFQSMGAPVWLAFAQAPLPAAVLLLAALSTELWLSPFTGSLKWPVRLYVALITVMGLAALALPPGHGWVAVGAFLFILSDMVLSIRLFRMTADDPRRAPAAWLLWGLYIVGQALIAGSIAPV